MIAYKQRMGQNYPWMAAPALRLADRRAAAGAVLLVVVVGLGWWLTVSEARRMPGMVDGLARAGGEMAFDTGPVRFAGMWIAMLAAMMLPGIIPLVARSSHARPLAGTAVASGYLAVWLPTAAIAFAALTALNEVSQPSPWLRRAGGAVIALAGAYQFTRYKRQLSENDCGRGQLGVAEAFESGLSHGVRCLGSSWALMAVLLVVGVMNVGWMAVISVVTVAEKAWPQRRTLRFGIGLTLIALGFAILLSPQTLAAIAELRPAV
ncbi:DUF2182 domain-containing protein [Mycobacterium kyorinense]|uniref:Metal-binding protein n=2 Tax=Mycobacterium kyorinense TaxID=487514 RepID=A0A1X1YFX6_9MYCO|nr:DUF2182 domain-containing protein [Mycobacterium kyorinense]ORW10002.1 hypothetical protein AWC14_21180 [Mycobacterium kyorinense]